MTAVESILEFVLRRLTTNELSTVSNYYKTYLGVVLLVNLIYQCSW